VRARARARARAYLHIKREIYNYRK